MSVWVGPPRECSSTWWISHHCGGTWQPGMRHPPSRRVIALRWWWLKMRSRVVDRHDPAVRVRHDALHGAGARDVPGGRERDRLVVAGEVGVPAAGGEVFRAHRDDERGRGAAEGRQIAGCRGGGQQHRERVVLLLSVACADRPRRPPVPYGSSGPHPRRSTAGAGASSTLGFRTLSKPSCSCAATSGSRLPRTGTSPSSPRRPTVIPRLRSARDSAGSAPSWSRYAAHTCANARSSSAEAGGAASAPSPHAAAASSSSAASSPPDRHGSRGTRR